MPPISSASPHISAQLRQLIYYHLDNNLLRNAIFLASRLHAHEPKNTEAIYLVSLCYLLSGQSKTAWEYSRNAGSRGTHFGCSYVYAQACLDLGKYMEGITALERSRSLWIGKNNWNKHSETRRQHLPDAPAILSLQGKLWHAHRDIHKAVDCYVEALKLNPFLWDAFLGLCETGANVRAPNIFKMSPEMLAMITTSPPEDLPSSGKPLPANHILQTQPNASNIDPFSANSSTVGSSALWEKLNGSNVSISTVVPQEGMETPVANNETEDVRLRGGVSGDSWEPPLAPARKTRSVQTGAEYSLDPPPKMKTATRSRTRARADAEDTNSGRETSTSVVGDRKRTVSGQITSMSVQPPESGAPQRRSARLFNHIRPTTGKFSNSNTKEGREIKKMKAIGVKGRSVSGTATARAVSGPRRLPTSSSGDAMEIDSKDASKESKSSSSSANGTASGASKTVIIDRSKEIEAVIWILELLSKLASGYSALASFKCQEAVQTFNTLPQNHRETPWVLSQIGRAFYEQALYPEAERFFVRVRTIAPSRLEDMEVYSTVLWHLKNDVELAYLSHELMTIDRLSPQAWCALGNSLSLQGDHDDALRCFKRATQLDPGFAYAFTLQGHEHVSNEEHDKALGAYRDAIHADNRHYNAWYGLGKVYERMGKYKFAEQHYRTASSINPTNVVLICCIGLVLERMGHQRSALNQYNRACSLSPQSVLARIRKARSLMKIGELMLALTELRVLKDIAPDEANVHYLLGKLYKMMHDKGNAIKHFTTALNLDPKAAQFIKDAMESLGDQDDMDEDMT